MDYAKTNNVGNSTKIYDRRKIKMRKNYTYECSVPESRNDLIDMINSRKSAILLKNDLIGEIHKELNKENKKANKSGGLLVKGGIGAGIWALFFSYHPLGWLIGGTVALTTGIIKNMGKILNNYETYKGKDCLGNDIYVMIYSDVDLKLDTINYPALVQNINYKKTVKKLKIQ